MSFYGLTFSGVDESVHSSAMEQVCALYFPIEWGINCALELSEEIGAVPDPGWIRNLPENLNYCANLHGQLALDFLQGKEAALRGKYGKAMAIFNRFQLHFSGTPDCLDLNALRALWSRYSDKRLTILVPDHSREVAEAVLASGVPCSIIFRLPDTPENGEWPKADRRFLSCGYGGSLGPDNVYRQAPALVKAAKQARSWWIEMESTLRVSCGSRSVFKIARCQKAITEIDNYFMHYVI